MIIKRKSQEKTNKKDIESVKLIDYFFSTEHTKFIHLLKVTKKWSEFHRSNASKLSLGVSLISSIIWLYIFNNTDIDVFNQILRDITSSIFAALIGMLGFIISGLAILTGTINDKLIDLIDKKELSAHIISILYSFYFIGAIIGVTIFMFLFMYLLSFPDIIATDIRVVLISFLLSYMFCFSIFYSIALLGTCLRIFLVSYKFVEDDKKEKKCENINS